MIPWLDRVPAAPTVGLHFKAWFRSRDAVFDRLAPLFARWDEEGQVLAFTEHGPIGLRVDSTGGFAVQIDLLNVNVMSESNIEPSGREGLEQPERTFSAALDEVVRITSEVVKQMLREETRLLVRAGLVASAKLERAQLPPGISRWPEELGRPWGALTGGQGRFTAPIGSGDGYQDRCHHYLRFESEKTPITLRLDWQRVYDPPSTIGARSIKDHMGEWSKSALAYFERLGEGLSTATEELGS